MIRRLQPSSWPELYIELRNFFTTCEKSIMQHNFSWTETTFCVTADMQDVIELHRERLTEAPSMHRNMMIMSYDSSVCIMSVIIVISCPVESVLQSIYEKGNLKPLRPKNINWSTVLATSMGFALFVTVVSPELSQPRSTNPVIDSPSPSGCNCTPDWIVISSKMRPPVLGESVLSISVYIHWIKLWFIPGSFSRLFLYFFTKLSLGIYKTDEISR